MSTPYTTPPDEHFAGVLQRWIEHYVKQAQADYDRAVADAAEERIELRIAVAVKAERDRYTQSDWSGGFGEQSPEQAHAAAIKRADDRVAERWLTLQNNLGMQAYIDRITKAQP